MNPTIEPFEIPATAPGEVIRGHFVPGAIRHFAVVYVHGLGGHRGGEKSAALQAECARLGWNYLCFDFRSHGESMGTMRQLTGSRLLDDLETIEKFLVSRGVQRLYLVGSSMGGWASSWFSTRRSQRVAGCVLLAPAFRFLDRRWEQLTEEEQKQWQSTGVFRLQNSWIDVELGYELIQERPLYPTQSLLQNWRHPLLIFHGLADDVVPFQDSVEFLSGIRSPNAELRLLKSGDHRLTDWKDEIARETTRWITSRETMNRELKTEK
jgi:pimeloyl-ACP methyl ester carboxylesterase